MSYFGLYIQKNSANALLESEPDLLYERMRGIEDSYLVWICRRQCCGKRKRASETEGSVLGML